MSIINRNQIVKRAIILLSLSIFCFAGCQTAYYAVWEKLGKEKRHLLRDQVEYAREDQKKASEDFKDALTRIKEIYGFNGGELETYYNKLNSDYEQCSSRADDLKERIDKIERIASDLFSEWEGEIDEIGNERFREQSAQSLRETKQRYARLKEAMITARSRMDPILHNLRDYVLYLKHNLNAQAIGVLKKEVSGIESDVDRLIRDISRSIQEADGFLKNME